MTTRAVTFTLNGEAVTGEVDPRTTLADFLRHGLGRTGTHLGCEHGVCGACTVRVDGRAVRGCLMLAVQAEAREIATVEGLAAPDGSLNPLQQAMEAHHGLQCGFCTPGVLMSLTELLETEPEADEAMIRDWLSGHLCRCTGYQGIVDAALAAVAAARGAR